MRNSPLNSILLLLAVSYLISVCAVHTQAGRQQEHAIRIQAGGSSFAARLYQQAITEYTLINTNISMSYASMSSARGTCRLMGYSDYCDTVSDKDEPTAISWSGTDSTLTEAEYEQCRDLQMYPAAAGAMAVVFNLPGWRSQTERLILTPQIVARIFRANITSWAHPHIVQLNAKLYEAGILTNASIKVVVREEASGNTDIFKSSLAKYDPDFLEQIGTSNQPVWPGVNVERQSNGFPLTSYVLNTPYTISYVPAGEAKVWDLPTLAILQPDGTVIEATGANVQVALVELWLGLGSTSDGKHLLWATRVQNASGSAVSVPDTSGHAGARGSLSWPFTGFSYILLRKNTTQRDAGEDCATRREVVKFWRWFYTSTVVASIASDQLMASLPLVAAEPVLRQLEREVMCEDKPAFEPVQKPKLSIVGPGDFVRLFRGLSIMYQSAHPGLEVGFTLTDNGDYASIPEDVNPAHSTSVHLVRCTMNDSAAFRARTRESHISIPFAGIGIGIIHSLCKLAVGLECSDSEASPELVLDLMLLDAILNEEVRFWHDAQLLDLNPWLRRDNGSAVLQNAPIHLWGSTMGSTVMLALGSTLRANGYSGEMSAFTSGSAHAWSSSSQVRESTAQTPGSMGIALLVEEATLPLVAIRPREKAVGGLQDALGPAIRPSYESAMQCVHGEQEKYGCFFPELSLAEGCYPLTVAFSLVVQRDYSAGECSAHDDGRGGAGGIYGGDGVNLHELEHTVDQARISLPDHLAHWLEWMFCDGASSLQNVALCGADVSAPSRFAASLSRAGIVPLSLLTPKTVLDALFSISCDGVSLLKKDEAADDAFVYSA
mmetsp:Transcript_28690/g.62834  ORF Transcript_28690/g.62834 Transcript_28690/m.62834 type:complete len:832 (-) Transcript_28690:109-2604(-)